MVLKLSRESVVRAVNVILRVPALFLVEAWYRTDPKSMKAQYSHFAARGKLPNIERSQEIIIHTIYYSVIVLAVTLTLLPLRKLVNLYMYGLSAALMAAAHYLSFLYVETEKEAHLADDQDSGFTETDWIERLGYGLASQCIISAIIAYLINLKHWTKACLLIYTLPMLARIFNYPVNDLHRVHNFSAIFSMLVIAFYIFHQVPLVLDMLKSGINKMMIAVQLYGWIPFLVAMWFKILLPIQFLLFWVVLFMVQLFKYLSVQNHPILSEGWIVVLLASVGECCVTPISLMGICVTVSYVSYLILTVTKLYLQGREAFLHDNVMHHGWTEGFTMFLLAIQTGIIELKSPQRAFLMSIVLFIVLSSLIQSMFEITDPILLALSASQNKSISKHARALVLCTFLWMFPLYMTHFICQFFELDFWLMVVISSCLLTSVQVMGSLIVYVLFIYDAVREEPWEKLDDIVYYAKATTRVLEFVVAVFVVCYGIKESLTGDWSWVNTSILIIHCYFNVWQRLQAGWKSYLLRREAVKKIESLPLATAEQLAELNDVCAICFQELKTARITPCHHFFHALCLRKWLYVQENCPMCHQKIVLLKEEQAEQNGQHEQDDNQQHEQNGSQQLEHDIVQQHGEEFQQLSGQEDDQQFEQEVNQQSEVDVIQHCEWDISQQHQQEVKCSSEQIVNNQHEVANSVNNAFSNAGKDVHVGDFHNHGHHSQTMAASKVVGEQLSNTGSDSLGCVSDIPRVISDSAAFTNPSTDTADNSASGDLYHNTLVNKHCDASGVGPATNSKDGIGDHLLE